MADEYKYKYLAIMILIICVFASLIVALRGIESSPPTGSVVKDTDDLNIKWVDKTLKDDTFVLKSSDVYYYGGNYKSSDKTIKLHYVVTSSAPVDIYVVASESDFRLIGTSESFVHYPSCRGIQILRYDRECTISSDGGIAIVNKEKQDATVSLKVSYFKAEIN